MKNTDILIKEHDVIIRVLNVFEEEALNIKKNNIIQKEYILSMLDFFRDFADKLHHAKEEVHLFEMLITKGMERKDSPVESMFMEHEKGREHVRKIREFLLTENPSEISEKLNKEMNAFVNLLRDHIDKENNMIFIMADNFITQDDDTALAEIYTKIEEEQKDLFTKYRSYAGELIKL